MIFAYKDIKIFMITTFFLGLVISIFLPFKLHIKIIFLFALLIALIAFSLFSFRRRIDKVYNRNINGNPSGFLSDIDKLIKKSISKKGKDVLLMHKLLRYLVYNDLANATEIINYFENTNSKILNDTYYSQTIFLLHLKHKNIGDARKMVDDLKMRMRNDKLACTKFNMQMYDSMLASLKVYESDSHDELLELEKRYLSKFDESEFKVFNIDIAAKLIVIYKKLGNKKEEKKYRDYIMDNVGDYYTFLD